MIYLLYEIDDATGEAQGTVWPFCGEACRSNWAEANPAEHGLGYEEGDSRADNGTLPDSVCCRCRKPLKE